MLTFTGARHVLEDWQTEVKFIAFTLETGFAQNIISDKITFVIDRTGMNTEKTDAKFAAHLIPILQKHYPELLSRMYIFPTNTLFNMMWKMSFMFLDPVTANKIHLVQGNAVTEWIPAFKHQAATPNVIKTVSMDALVIWEAPAEFQVD